MPLNFGSDPEPDERRNPRPPNYSSRWVQIRLLMLVALLMLVGVAMFEARNPKYYRWLGLGDNEASAPTDNEFVDEDVDTRLRAAQVASNDVDADTTDSTDDQAPAQIDGVHRESIETWTNILGQLSTDDRLLLYRVVKTARGTSPLTDGDKKNWIDILKQLDQGWEKYDNNAVAAVLEMSDDDESKPIWLAILHQVRENWKLAKDAFQLVFDERYLLPKDKQVLDDLQVIFDEIALKVIKDNTLTNRAIEYDAWFRCLEMVQSSSPDELKNKSEGRVGFLQLYRQPVNYRGKVVTVRGTAKMAYHVRAPKNIFGIPGYYIFIVKPLGGPNSPLTIYSLEVPLGFPEIKDRDLDKTTTTLEEDVEFTGIFFKNRAYRAQDNTRVSPTIIAKSPKWDGPANQLNQNTWIELPSVMTMLLSVLGIAVVGTLLAVFVYMQHRGSSPVIAKYDATNRTTAKDLKTLEKEATTVTLADRLRQITSDQFDKDEQSESDD